MALLLQLIPPFSMFFLMTTAAGSALWVAEIEDKRALLEERRDPANAGYHDEEAN